METAGVKKYCSVAFLTGSLSLTLYGCGQRESSVTFNEAQPVGAGGLRRFPERLRGVYENTGQNAVLTVTDSLVIQDFVFRIHKDSLENGLRVKGDSLVDLTTGESLKISLHADTIYGRFFEPDTVFKISETNVLKKFKGHYFLNKRESDGAWSVKRLSLYSGRLVIGIIADSVEIENLKAITETPSDTTDNLFKPTRQQFKKFVKKGGFSVQDTFYRRAKSQPPF